MTPDGGGALAFTRSDLAHYWQRADRAAGPGGCWPWRGARCSRGYGYFRAGGKNWRAHRVAYEAAFGPLPSGVVVRHACENRACVNPAHLVPGSQAENVADTIRNGSAWWQRGQHSGDLRERVFPVPLAAPGAQAVRLAPDRPRRPRRPPRRPIRPRRRETLLDRMQQRLPPLDPVTGCRTWTGATDGAGYGLIKERGRWLRAHRVAWILARGAIPAGLCVLHRCDNRRCVNPAHLFIGTRADNSADMAAKGRGRRGGRPDDWVTTPKLTPNDVAAIRDRYRVGARQTALAEEFGVSVSAISRAVRGDTWPRGSWHSPAFVATTRCTRWEPAPAR